MGFNSGFKGLMCSLTPLQKHTLGPYTNQSNFLHLLSDYFCFALVAH